jgi:hypothetical protein
VKADTCQKSEPFFRLSLALYDPFTVPKLPTENSTLRPAPSVLRVMMFTTPPMAREPWIDDPPGNTSMRSTPDRLRSERSIGVPPGIVTGTPFSITSVSEEPDARRLMVAMLPSPPVRVTLADEICSIASAIERAPCQSSGVIIVMSSGLSARVATSRLSAST